jgi:hypothetical protein
MRYLTTDLGSNSTHISHDQLGLNVDQKFVLRTQSRRFRKSVQYTGFPGPEQDHRNGFLLTIARDLAKCANRPSAIDKDTKVDQATNH